MSRTIYMALGIIFLVLLFSSYNPNYANMAAKRLSFAEQNEGDIEITLIWDLAKSNYLKGAFLAVEEINKRPEKLLGRSLKINVVKEADNFSDFRTTLQRIAAKPETTAVLGHRNSSIAIPVSALYETSQILFLCSFATAQKLMGHNFHYTFRMAPNNAIMSEQLANVARTFGYQNIVILYARTEVNREQAFLFEDALLKQGINISKRTSFFDKERNYRPIISQISNESFDAVFISSSPEAGGRMVKQLREMGIRTPILGTDSLNHPSYAKTAGKAGDNTIIPALYRPDESNVTTQKFIKQYRKKHKNTPDYNAAQGYDSVMLLAATIERADSTLSPLLASTLRFMPAWTGVTGIHAFNNQTGELQGKKYFFSVLKEGKIHDLPAVHVPYLLGRFSEKLKNRYQKNTSKKKTEDDRSEGMGSVNNDDNEESKAYRNDSEELLMTEQKDNDQQNIHQDSTDNTTDIKLTDFPTVFSKHLHDDQHKIYLLDLAQEILGFKRLGIIYENTPKGRKEAGYELLESLAYSKKITVVGCEVPFSELDEEEIKQAMLQCYGTLSLNIDAMFLPSYHNINETLSRYLNNSLTFFKIPSIAFNTHYADSNITLMLGKRSDINPLDIEEGAHIYNNLLNGIKAHELIESLAELPEITVNLTNLQKFDLDITPILLLSPDKYSSADDKI